MIEIITKSVKPPKESVRPTIAIEEIDDVSVGRQILSVRTIISWIPNETVLCLIDTLNRNNAQSERARHSLTFSLNNNSPNTNTLYGHNRGLSAYFTYNPSDETVIVEWGTIDPRDGVAKLHTHLNRVIDFKNRSKMGMKISLGYITQVQSGVWLALIDNLISYQEE